jgi:hypothetical protein
LRAQYEPIESAVSFTAFNGNQISLGVQDQSVTEEGISQTVRTFIADHIESVVQLEILLLLFNAPGKDWRADDIGRELRIDPSWAAAQLADLCSRGLITCDEGPNPNYRYGPRSPDIEQAIVDLNRAYTDMRVTVISLIFSKPADKIRIFADAFKIRKDKSDG